MNALTTRGRDLAPTTMAEAMEFARMLAASDMVPKDFRGKPGNCILAIQWGAEIGLGPLQAIQNIAVVNGRPSLWGDAAMALVRAHPACEWVREGVTGEGDQRTGWCEVKRRGHEPERRTFGVADAKRAGLWGKQGPWQQYPDRMLQLRARGFALRDVFPDALRGAITVEEARDIPAEPRDVPNMAPAGALAELQPPADEVLRMIDPDGVEREIRASKTNPAIMIWLAACRKAVAKMESADALRGWRAEMGPTLAEMSDAYPGEVAAVEELCSARLDEFAPAVDEPADDFPGDR